MATNQDSPTSTDQEVADLFERGAIYADRWPTALRVRLDVPDPLTSSVRSALSDGQHVIITGAAGDGKSHLAVTALDDLQRSSIVEVVRNKPLIPSLPQGTVVFIRDVSALADSDVLDAIQVAQSNRFSLLLTINEGPLDVLAQRDTTGFLGEVRKCIHSRTRGLNTPDPAGSVVINLSGRQLTRGQFVAGALEKLLPVVRPCRVCGKSKTCPRYKGAQLLKRNKLGPDRLAQLLQTLSDRGRHLTAREIWAFLIDLFFGWTCTGTGDEIEQQPGYFWNRVFEGDNSVSELIAADFDPLNVARAADDSNIWSGRFESLQLSASLPSTPPHIAARTEVEDGLILFSSAKRFLFFFGKAWDIAATLAEHVPATKFGALLAQASSDKGGVAPELAGLINAFRLGVRTQSDLWISRHHAFSAHRRASTLAASGKIPSTSLKVRIPFSDDATHFPGAGFFPSHLLLAWGDNSQEFTLDFETWKGLQQERTLIVDRDQETLDFALDVFLAQANAPDMRDPEILVYDHRRRRATTLRVSTAEKRVDVL